MDSTPLYPGVLEMLLSLQNRQMAIVTNKPTNMTHKILQGLNIDDFFGAVRGGDDVARKKPDPTMIHEVMDELKMDPQEAIMIGDSPVDVRAARKAGIRVCGVTYGGIGAVDALVKSAPDFLVDSPDQLSQLLI